MEPNQVVVYVEDAEISREFYGSVLNIEGESLSPAFTVYPLKNGWTLALWLKGSAPMETPPAGGIELVFDLSDREAVDRTAAEWRARNVPFALEPVETPFGYSFIGLDPDGTRLRVGYFPQG